MKKIIAFILICVSMLLAGCKDSNADIDREIVINSRVNCTITVPKSDENRKMEVFWQLDFYQIYVNKELYPALEGKSLTYRVGEDAELTGDNVEQLHGATINISQYDMSEMANDNYFSDLADEYYQEYMDGKEPADSKLQKRITDIISKCIDKAKVVSVNFVVDGCFDRDVKVKSLYIPELGFDFPMDDLRIETIEIPDNVEFSYIDEVVDSASWGGMVAGNHIAKYNFYSIDGTALADISKISVESANTCCEVITAENHKKYEEADALSVPIYVKQKETDYKKDSTVNLEYCYAFANKLVENSDTTIASLIVKTELADGRQIWSFEYPLSLVWDRYLLLDIVDEEMK
ncbi:MAG: hypothetical protein J6L77_11040 [Coprococcus sp.]|nr:hypothetical protein [Coprococcus sp.]